MIKYAKIINEETKEVQIGEGTNSAFYQSLGMEETDVEKGYNGSWYLAGHAPAEPEENIKARQRAEIIRQLENIDLKTIRALRALQAGQATSQDNVQLASWEAQAVVLRAQLQALDAASCV